MLEAFGGFMTLQEFRAKSDTLAYDVMPPKMAPLNLVIDEQRLAEIGRHAALPKQDMEEIIDLSAKSTSKVETLRLRQPKQKKTSEQSLLERTLGLRLDFQSRVGDE
jgi:hypothetical protein